MKKIFALLIAVLFAVAAVSCGNNSAVNNDTENNGVDAEQTETPEAETPVTEEPGDDVPENGAEAPENDGTPKAVSYEKFKELVEYSMYPYDTTVQADKNMVHAVTGYNGKVELTYFSFTANEDAAAYFDEIAETFPGDVVEKTEDGEYEFCKLAEGDYCYMMVRIDNTIVYGSCKNDYQPVFDWLYGLGYVTK